MRRLFLKLSLGASAILGLFGQGKAPEPKASKMSADDLKKLADSKKKFFFLDVREPKELEDLGTMKGFVNIPLGQLEQRLSEIPKDSLVVTAWNRGGRAARAAVILEKAGYKTIGYCGMLEWKEKGYDLVYPKSSEKK